MSFRDLPSSELHELRSQLRQRLADLESARDRLPLSKGSGLFGGRKAREDARYSHYQSQEAKIAFDKESVQILQDIRAIDRELHIRNE